MSRQEGQLNEAIAHAIYDELSAMSHNAVSVKSTQVNNWVVTDQIIHAVGICIAVVGDTCNEFNGKVVVYEQGSVRANRVFDPADPAFTAREVAELATAYAAELRKMYLA